MNASLVQTVLVYALPVLLAITLHEVAHGWVAKQCGDMTAYNEGRITLNPLRHIDPMGTIVMPLLLLFSTGGAYALGYARPVPVNFGRLRRPRTQQFWVILAGPMSNFLQALLWAVLYLALGVAGVTEPFFLGMANAGVSVNLVMWAFNLFPVPPLDGGRVLVGLLPYRQAQAVARIEPFGFFIVLALLVFDVISKFWVTPLVAAGFAVIRAIVAPLAGLAH